MASLSEQINTIMEREMGDIGPFIVKKQSMIIGANPDSIELTDLPELASKLSEVMKTFGGYEKARKIYNEIKELEDLSMGNPDQSSRVTAAVDWFGPTDFLQMDPQNIQLGREAHVHDPNSPESRLMGASVTLIPEKCKAATPMTYIRPGNAPIYIQHGTADPTIPYLQAMMLAEGMAVAIGKENVVLEIFENAGHAEAAFFTAENVNKILDFLDKYIK